MICASPYRARASRRATVDADDGFGDEGRFRRGETNDSGRRSVQPIVPIYRAKAGYLWVVPGPGEGYAGRRGGPDGRGHETEDADAVAGVLESGGPGQADHRVSGRGVAGRE